MNQRDLKGRQVVITGVAAGSGLGHHAAFAGLGDRAAALPIDFYLFPC